MLGNERPIMQLSVVVVPSLRRSGDEKETSHVKVMEPITLTADAGGVESVRDLARRGQLSRSAAAASPIQFAQLTRATYHIAWPVVFTRLTRGIELRRGHPSCSASVLHLADDCLNGFHDDVEAVVDDVLNYANKPIDSLEAWIASRLTAATVDGHRRRRGRRGALQRPRLPKWLAAALGHDRWLTDLATQILVWVGIPATAGTGVWPLDVWAHRRGVATTDWTGSDPTRVEREIELVLTAMRQHPKWYQDYVETPLGRKEAPVLSATPFDDARTPEPSPLALTDQHELDDSRMIGLAADAMAVMEARLRRGEDEAVVIADVIRTLFGADTGAGELDRVPHTASAYDERVSALLRDPAEAQRIIVAVLAILGDDSDGADRGTGQDFAVRQRVGRDEVGAALR